MAAELWMAKVPLTTNGNHLNMSELNLIALCQENPSFPVKNQKIEDNGQLHAQEAAKCQR